MASHTWSKLLIVLFVQCLCCYGARKRPAQCEDITIPMCKDMEYKKTYMPNVFNHGSQGEAGLEAHQFYPLVEIKCSPDLKFFLCSMYAPICLEDYDQPLPACRSVCERTKAGCEPIMTQYGFDWPSQMNCDKFPRHGDPDHLCMDNQADKNKNHSVGAPPPEPHNVATQKPAHTPAPAPGSPVQPGKTDISGGQLPRSSPSGPGSVPSSVPGFVPLPGQDLVRNGLAVDDAVTHLLDGAVRQLTPKDPCACQCVDPFVKLTESSTWYNKVHTGDVANCAMNCRGPYFGPDEHSFTEWWLRVWSVLCFISTFVTVVTFSLDVNRFQYPERPVIFLSVCYLMVSLGYIIRLAAGHESVACQGETILYKTTGPALCTVVFLLLYVFGMASSLWWVILSLTWFLSAGLKWAQEAIASYAQYFHLVAWSLPCIKAVTILLLSSVDGDTVSGVCYVGNQDSQLLLWFVVIPLCLYLLLGSSFLVAGFISLFRIRSVIKQQGGQKTEKLEKLMIRIGIFSLLYTLPAAVVIACYFYEMHFKHRWEQLRTCPCSQGRGQNDRPDFIIFMLKYFMCLVVGITSSCWVWSSKTVETWRKACSASRRRSGRGQKKIEAVRSDEMYASIAHSPPTASGYPLSHV